MFYRDIWLNICFKSNIEHFIWMRKSDIFQCQHLTSTVFASSFTKCDQRFMLMNSIKSLCVICIFAAAVKLCGLFLPTYLRFHFKPRGISNKVNMRYEWTLRIYYIYAFTHQTNWSSFFASTLPHKSVWYINRIFLLNEGVRFHLKRKQTKQLQSEIETQAMKKKALCHEVYSNRIIHKNSVE